jgi:hypothetical protein
MDTSVVSIAMSSPVSKNHIFAETCLPASFLETAACHNINLRIVERDVMATSTYM